MTRFITLFRKPDNRIEWEFYISEDIDEVKRVIFNLELRDISDFSTYELGPKRHELSQGHA